MSEMTYEQALDTLEHHGVKGMKWGVRSKSTYSSRTQGTIDRNRRVAAGTASKGDLVKTFYGVGRHGVGGVYGIKTAGKFADNKQAHLDRINTGKATSKDIIQKYGRMTILQIARESKAKN